jgi:ProP effector
MDHRLNTHIETTIALLCERFPKCFAQYEARRRPLKVGIHHDILAKLDGALTPDELGKALQVYVLNKVYRQRLRAGATRIDLDGNPAGIVTPQQATPFVKRPEPKPPPAPPPKSSLADLKAAALRRKTEAPS